MGAPADGHVGLSLHAGLIEYVVKNQTQVFNCCAV